MNKATDPILTVLRRSTESDLWLSRSIINENVQRLNGDQPSKMTVYRSFDDLVDYGLIKQAPDDDSLYKITETGIGYLEGNVDASQLERGSSSE